ncbi:hypothetical protein [Leptospira licerasiae]|uniref:Low molecular weight phosphotyrosine protein phosphatase domain protein n=1 Tax=Leptospira licerasiae str. MMD4847 TaxID=1049971 RepID=A0ABP2RBL2_9LEPT|nr:hypothetical protein [Leptospira licerasiae]EID99939.1 low molecular weight phosphotyrosine protein phosphatase domain protein [Leptospira licerasiae serovar Varillal str. VAR 010]EJZ41962.1 low molecular weight phosphotyrosine protein phosphatase domain protein [Leptospira licerasiae str. MMD4847]
MSKLFDPIQVFLSKRESESSFISEERRKTLLQFASEIRELKLDQNYFEIVFVCTHNSRRSQIAQIFALACAEYLGLSGIGSYSGGTEVTSFHTNSVQALANIGFKIEKEEETENNPKYLVSYKEGGIPVPAYSKLYSDFANPKKKFIAVLVCSSADEACPYVPGAKERISLPYSDPKEFDSSSEALGKYIETCETIARELLFVMDHV